MTLTHILVFAAFALLAGWLLPARWRGCVVLAASIVAVYWLQPSTPLRNLDFWFPTFSIGLTVFVWSITLAAAPAARATWVAALLIAGVILAIALTRYLGPACCLTPSRPPAIHQVALALAFGAAAAALPARLLPSRRFLAPLAITLLIGLFIILKTEALALETSAGLRRLAGQDASLAEAVDLRWLGFSYLAFRLLHALRDNQAGRLPVYSLGEFVTYAIFFPAYTAGPIDRSQHFVAELRRPAAETAGNFVEGARRILVGVFKKFVLADTLALIALNGQNASQVQAAGWMWLLLYAYTLRIYFDFSGYTDIALGLSRLLGITLPENFDRPYLKTNLTAFWNSWHITLAQWFRAYFFNPLTRSLRQSTHNLPAWAVLLAGQVGVMLLIGLWHGITPNFALWGAWHGAGLFIHNRWSGWIRPRAGWLEARPRARAALTFASWLLTFHFVALGWVWFALPNLPLAGHVFSTLFGG